ncbi:flagellar protein FliS [Sphingomonas vulcanisoli]|uniref:Flagellar protein FliS n=1 Tax=Sphingomonas vulcanisoli TaxID=1658060 RepID=A0ABX0TVX5_9SPHN|nr:flagellar export chaperone FliS [Sphingomonas vulcanisoli]NIJ09591.1 flagellar protein FliS [Sphingomonas vulcanisoli]
MFAAPNRMMAAYARYSEVDVKARVEGASPHGLILILFEELQKALATMAAAERAGDRGRSLTVQARALSMLHGLETGLDYERGGEIADTLGKIYREARRLLGTQGDARGKAIEDARDIINDISEAWAAIG